MENVKTIELPRKVLDFKKFVKRSALEKDCKELIKQNVLITEGGKPKILYTHLDVDTRELEWAVKRVKFHTQKRTSGLNSTSRVFGYNPRNAIRRDYCSSTSMSNDPPNEHAIICAFGEKISELYKEFFPEIFLTHDDIVKGKIMQEWKMGETPFTSGIVNKNNPLKYHFDAGNIKDVLSNMVVFKRKTAGGYLACPEFDVHLEAANNTVVLFDGQSILHGVTPIKNQAADAWRYSIVYYTLQQMWNCLPLKQEIARARNKHVAKERRRANGEVSMKDLQSDSDR